MTEIAPTRPRKFLVVVDNSPECRVALRFAARRALHTGGRVSLLCVAAATDAQPWKGVEDIMRDEAYREAENLIYDAAEIINQVSGILPEFLIEQGEISEALLDLIRRDKDISILVLASAAGNSGPGPLVELFAGSVQAIPATIVPGNLSDAEVDSLA